MREKKASDFNRHIKTAEQRTDYYYSNTVIGTLAVDGWAVTFGTTRRGQFRFRCTNFILFDVAL